MVEQTGINNIIQSPVTTHKVNEIITAHHHEQHRLHENNLFKKSPSYFLTIRDKIASALTCNHSRQPHLSANEIKNEEDNATIATAQIK